MNKLRIVIVAGSILACAGMTLTSGARSYATPITSFNLVNDGGFEDPPVAGGGGFDTYNSGNMGGWTVGGAGVDLINSYWTPEEGHQSVDMNALGAGSLSQTVNGLQIGKSYQLSFWLAGNPSGGPSIKTLDTSLDGSNVHSYQFDITGHSTGNMGWTEYSYDFTAANTSTNLAFTSTTTAPCTPASGSAACGPALDNVAIRAVPEAATTVTAFVYVLLSGLVLMIRNRKRATVKASV